MNICQEICDEYQIPFRDIKVIGSAHIGFSLVKPKDTKEINFFSENSDLDIAIINKELFYKLYKLTLKKSKYFMNNTEFNKPNSVELFKRNILKGYIRPDTMGDRKYRTAWSKFFEELSNEYGIKLTAAIYLDEDTFSNKIKESLKIYRAKLEG